MISETLLAALPKTDLHVHLDGSLRETTLLELARDAGVPLPARTVEGLNALIFKPSYADLTEYLAGFAYTTAALQTEEALERSAYELALDNIAEGVCYVEVRFAPQLHMHAGLDFDRVLAAVNAGLARAEAEVAALPEVRAGRALPFRYGIIVCALRKFEAGFSAWYGQLLHLFRDAPRKQVYGLASLELARAAVRCRDRLGVPIVGFDLAGEEAGYPAHDHREAYAYAHKNFLKKTVHAGEAYGPESIFDAITELHADRIGHGYHLFDPAACDPTTENAADFVNRLGTYIADRRITVEVCITSNLQTNPAIGSVEAHALGRMLAGRLSATLCTDNRLVSHTTVTRELSLAARAFALDTRQLRNIIIYGFKRSFFFGTYSEKRAWVRQVIDTYDRVAGEAEQAEQAGA